MERAGDGCDRIPAQLLKELADLETDTMKKVQELMEMARDYE